MIIFTTDIPPCFEEYCTADPQKEVYEGAICINSNNAEAIPGAFGGLSVNKIRPLEEYCPLGSKREIHEDAACPASNKTLSAIDLKTFAIPEKNLQTNHNDTAANSESTMSFVQQARFVYIEKPFGALFSLIEQAEKNLFGVSLGITVGGIFMMIDMANGRVGDYVGSHVGNRSLGWLVGEHTATFLGKVTGGVIANVIFGALSGSFFEILLEDLEVHEYSGAMIDNAIEESTEEFVACFPEVVHHAGLKTGLWAMEKAAGHAIEKAAEEVVTHIPEIGTHLSTKTASAPMRLAGTLLHMDALFDSITNWNTFIQCSNYGALLAAKIFPPKLG